MKITKVDALFLYSVLFSYTASNDGTSSVHAEDLMQSLSDFILDTKVEAEESDDDDDDDEYEYESDDDDDEEAVSAEFYLTPSTANSLSSVKVTLPTGERATLEFEDVGDDGSIDALVDGGSVVIEGVTHMKVESTSISLYDGEQWHFFGIKNHPKAWKNVVPNAVHGIKNVVVDDDGEEDE